MKGKRILRGFLVPVLALVFVLSTVKFVQSSVRSHQEQQAFDELASYVDATLEPTPLAAQTVAPERNDIQAACAASNPTLQEGVTSAPFFTRKPYVSPYLHLKEQNADFYGWLSIEGTVIDYPVMYTPNDPQYYLYRAFDQSSSQSGVPFLDASCFDGCGNYLIHGHNMKNGTMFATLLSYAQEDFWKQHPVIEFDTMQGSGSYQVMAAFYAQIYKPDEEGFLYYQYTDLSDSEDFHAYMDQVKQASLYETGITAQYGDQLLTLSTCSYHVQDGRFVVVARKEAE